MIDEVKYILSPEYDIFKKNGEIYYGKTHSLSDLDKILLKAGIKIIRPRYDFNKSIGTGEDDPQLSALSRASAVFMTGSSRLFENDNLIARLKVKLDEGLRIWIDVPSNYYQEGKSNSIKELFRFLKIYGVSVTTIRVSEFINKRGRQKHADGVFFKLKKSSKEGDFRDRYICKNVEKIEFYEAYALSLSGNAYATVAVYPENFILLDKETDDYELDLWAEKFIPLIATTEVGRKGGVIIVSSGLIIDNSFSHSFANIPSCKENKEVILNIAEFLTNNEGIKAIDFDEQVYRLIQKIERNLLLIIRSFWGKESSKWNDKVPEKSKLSAKERAENEGNKLPWEVYLNLTDLANIFGNNIKEFKSVLDELKLPTSKNKIMNEVLMMGKLNELRKYHSHETKRVLTEHSFTETDIQILSLIDQNLIKINHQITLREAKCTETSV